MKTGNLWDIFCRVIDNYGDIGVCWRLCAGLAERGERVRLWVDDASALNWMAPEGLPGVEVKPWSESTHASGLTVGNVLVEAFGCEIAPEFIAACAMNTCARGQKRIWINLEYLSAEPFVERCHGLPSPVMAGPGAGLTKYFYYPGFSAATGGLLREPGLLARQTRFNRADWLAQHHIEFKGERLISLFCYEPTALEALIEQLANDSQASRLLVTAGRATAAVNACLEHKNRLLRAWNGRSMLSFSYLPTITQVEYDHLLWACDLNFVRGEDSLVRALWAGKPFVWQIYPQHDDAHHTKLEAFLEVMKTPPSLRAFHRVWNGIQATNQAVLPALDLPAWKETALQARHQQAQLTDLVSQITDFVKINR